MQLYDLFAKFFAGSHIIYCDTMQTVGCHKRHMLEIGPIASNEFRRHMLVPRQPIVMISSLIIFAYVSY